MEAIRILREIISKLTSDEKATIRTYLKVFVLQGKGDSNRGVILFDYLTSLGDRSQTIENIELAVYKKSNKPALKRLANRTRIKVLEALIIDINVDRENIYSERVAANIDVRKKLTQAQILHRRGSMKIARNMIERVVDQCRKYELYEEQLIALRILIKSRTLDEGDKRLEELLKQYNECDYAKSAVMRAEINHTKIISQNDFHEEQSINPTVLRTMLDEMYEDFKQTNSAQIGNYYYHLEAQNCQQLRDYTKARTALLNNFKIIKKFPAINTFDNIIGVLLNLSYNDLFLGQFEHAFKKAEQAIKYCPTGNNNYEFCIEYMFYAKYYKGEYQIAHNLIYQYLPSEDQKANFRAGKRSYFLAATYFMLEDFQTAKRYLNLINPIEADKEGWNLGIKILQIMTDIELSDSDEATAKIEALKKYFANGNGTTNHRAKLINNIFLSLSYNGFNFKVIFQEQKSILQMLGEKIGDLEWKVKSSEMVIFHQWFFAKMSRQKFIQSIPSFQLENKKETVVKEN